MFGLILAHSSAPGTCPVTLWGGKTAKCPWIGINSVYLGKKKPWRQAEKGINCTFPMPGFAIPRTAELPPWSSTGTDRCCHSVWNIPGLSCVPKSLYPPAPPDSVGSLLSNNKTSQSGFSTNPCFAHKSQSSRNVILRTQVLKGIRPQ